MFDTHCHLNFKAFEGKVDRVIDRARKAGVNYFVIPGTDVDTSQKAIEIAEKFPNVYAAVGIHPHHMYQYQKERNRHPEFISGSDSKKQMLNQVQHDIKTIEQFISHPKVVAVGEGGLDRHYYQKTKYSNYHVDEEFVKLQKELFLEQLKLAYKYKKALIIHNREA